MTIEWFPGHMAKAKRQIAEVMPKVDIVIEVLDARLPVSSSNPLLEKLRGHKPCIKVLNKSDLADPAVTKSWVAYFDQLAGVKALPIEASKRSTVGQITTLCRRMVPNRGVPGKTLRAMVVGIPNVGKSTLINTLAGRKIARVGDKPAITTCPQQIDLRNGIHLADTPGLLWPDIRNQKSAYRLAVTGAIGDAAMDYVDVALYAAEYLMKHYPKPLAARYKFQDAPESASELVDRIGRSRGCLIAGGQLDQQRTSELLLRELRAGLIGRVSLESPEDFPEKGEDES
ncbi:MAG: ribosome biogenesis GTPase YlqF [Deltaproteobacteria bacterium]|nr:ribosome biogenesis GTPase YlqF [Deltaproteobacteria bacterium]